MYIEYLSILFLRFVICTMLSLLLSATKAFNSLFEIPALSPRLTEAMRNDAFNSLFEIRDRPIWWKQDRYEAIFQFSF